MKKIILFAFVLAAFVACSKTEPVKEGVPFEKGQKVTLSINAGESSKAVGILDADGKVNFTWEAGDKILVKVGESSSEFTLKSGEGEATAIFEGTMPGTASTFDVQYPVTGLPESSLVNQTYSSDAAIPHDMMLATAKNCSLDEDLILQPQYAALRLNLYGLDRKVKEIKITNLSSTADPQPSYTLACNPTVKVSNTAQTPTPFLIVVPAGQNPWKFKVEFVLEEVIPSVDGYLLIDYVDNGNHGKGIIVSCLKFETTYAQSFTAGSILEMPARSLTDVWAPVNCGYDTDKPYGLNYQWGRRYGQKYVADTTLPLLNMTKEDDLPQWQGYFGTYTNAGVIGTNWFSGELDNSLWNDSTKGTSDPCPEGWRVPTHYETGSLICDTGVTGIATTGWDDVNKGYWFDGSATPTPGKGLFLPAAGYYNCEASATFRGTDGTYWASSVSGSNAFYLSFQSTYARKSLNYRAYGMSVRCVQIF